MALTNLFAIVLRMRDIFLRSSVLEKWAGADTLTTLGWSCCLAGTACAASALVILPSFPDPCMEFAGIPFSSSIFEAAGDG